MCPQCINVSLTAFLLRPPYMVSGRVPRPYTSQYEASKGHDDDSISGRFLLHLCYNECSIQKEVIYLQSLIDAIVRKGSLQKRKQEMARLQVITGI